MSDIDVNEVIGKYAKKYIDHRDLTDVRFGSVGGRIYVLWFSNKANKVYYYLTLQKTTLGVISKFKSDVRSDKITLSSELMQTHRQHNDLVMYIAAMDHYRLRALTDDLAACGVSLVNIKKEKSRVSDDALYVYKLTHTPTGFYYLGHKTGVFDIDTVRKHLLINLSKTLTTSLTSESKRRVSGWRALEPSKHPHSRFIQRMSIGLGTDIAAFSGWTTEIIPDVKNSEEALALLEKDKGLDEPSMCLNIVVKTEKTRRIKKTLVSTDVSSDKIHYPEQDPEELDEAGNYVSMHVLAMTAEKLESKFDIACQLAWRDKQIDDLKKDIALLNKATLL